MNARTNSVAPTHEEEEIPATRTATEQEPATSDIAPASDETAPFTGRTLSTSL